MGQFLEDISNQGRVDLNKKKKKTSKNLYWAKHQFRIQNNWRLKKKSFLLSAVNMDLRNHN